MGGSPSPLGDRDPFAYLVGDGVCDRDRNAFGDVHGVAREHFNRGRNRNRDGDDFRHPQHPHPDSDSYDFDDSDCDRDGDLHGDGDVDGHIDLDARDRVLSGGAQNAFGVRDASLGIDRRHVASSSQSVHQQFQDVAEFSHGYQKDPGIIQNRGPFHAVGWFG